MLKVWGPKFTKAKFWSRKKKKKGYSFIQTSHFFKYIFHAVFKIITQNI